MASQSTPCHFCRDHCHDQQMDMPCNNGNNRLHHMLHILMWPKNAPLCMAVVKFASMEGALRFVCHPFDTTHPFNGPLSGTTRVSQYPKGKTNLDFNEARDSEWQWHQLGHMQVCICSRQITTPAPHHSVFLQAGCPSYCTTNASNH